jgi:hypothetical protein
MLVRTGGRIHFDITDSEVRGKGDLTRGIP